MDTYVTCRHIHAYNIHMHMWMYMCTCMQYRCVCVYISCPINLPGEKSQVVFTSWDKGRIQQKILRFITWENLDTWKSIVSKRGSKWGTPLFQACSLYHILWTIVSSSQGENLSPLLPMKDEGDRPHHPGYSASAWDCFELRHLKTHKYSKEAGGKTALRKLYWFPKSGRNIWKRASLAQLDLGGTLLE